METKRENLPRLAALFIGIYLILVLLFYMITGENARIAVPDNLDLFQPQFQMLKENGLFFASGAEVPFLHGVTRDDLPSQFWLPSLLYMGLPPFAAYVANYILKVVIGIVSFVLLAKELQATANRGQQAGGVADTIILLCGFCYGLVNFFPTFGICFSSIPLILYLLIRLKKEESGRAALKWYLLIFCYPLISYFSYFGLFILAYMAVYWLGELILTRRFDRRLLIAIIVLSAGFILFEYRLFASMLLSDTVTIRSVADMGDLSAAQVVSSAWFAFKEGGMHESGLQQKLVMPVCLIWFVLQNVRYLKTRNLRGAAGDIFNRIMALLVFNSAIYGLYYSRAFRSLVEKLVPPLTGWQFGGTSFFNAFLWYGAFCIVLIRIARYARRESLSRLLTALVCLAPLAAAAVILLSDTTYNDLYHTAHAQANQLLRGKAEESLTYREFYSEKLFEKAKQDIGYGGEWSAAYGFYPAILEYDGIATIDGYLGFYPLEYKEKFRRAIAPALEKNEGSAAYFDSWGARCYLYSGVSPIIVEPVRTYAHENEEIDIDPAALRELDCRYIFSRICLTNAEGKDLTLRGTYTDEESPYILYVYELGGVQ